MGLINILNDAISEYIKQSIDVNKKQNTELAKSQIESIRVNPYLSDAVKEYLICGVLQQLEKEQSTQSAREFLLNLSKGLNEASKFAEQMANKQEK